MKSIAETLSTSLSPMDAAHLVREARLRAGLTQAELAARSGTTQSALARLEAGASSPAFTRVVDLVERCGLGLRVRIVDTVADPVPERDRTAPADGWAFLAPLVQHGVRFVVSGLAAAAARGLADRERPPTIVPDDARANLLLMGAALSELGARVRVEDGSLPFVGTPESLLSRPRWELVGPDGPLDLVFAPPGTRGYRDLVRDAAVVSVGGVGLPVASLRDAIRELEAAGADPELVHRLRVALGEGPRRS